MVLSVFALPLIVGTAWALIPAFLAALLTIVRTVKEDDFLKSSLEGYREYATRVPFRVVPFVW
jgi:protein-S-isoprenylcysteine O-methyltransferase Ste14